MTPIAKIDSILGLLCEDDMLRPFATDGQIFNAFLIKYPDQSEQTYLGSDVLAILGKLDKDDYIRKETIEIPASEHFVVFKDEVRYYVTFEGMLFHQQGGYAEQLRQHDAENTRLISLEKAAGANRRWMLWLTVLVAIGTSVAGWYYAIEIWKHYQHIK